MRGVRWVVSGFAVALLAQVGVALASGGGGGGGGGGSMDFGSRMTPEDMARQAFSDGVRAVKQGKKYEEQADEAKDDKKKTKAAERAQQQFEKARAMFVNVVKEKPTMHEAWNYVGYTSRKLGDYTNSLAAYERALQIKPGYPEAIEYRGEAYLGLNRLDDAKNAYMTLFANARPLADELMAAMQKWVTARRADASGVATADLDKFDQWINERKTVAQQTASLAVDGSFKVNPDWN
jgi:tetratricopeptide (TPR) repeat protein